jgi:hypothetical protein
MERIDADRNIKIFDLRLATTEEMRKLNFHLNPEAGLILI